MAGRRSMQSDQQAGDRHTTCSKCRCKVLKVKTPGGYDIEVLVDTDVRWYVETDLIDDRFAGKPVHAHEEHMCWKDGEKDDGFVEAESGVVEGAPEGPV